ncbi:IS1634 family transposase [Patescibacteria group bacterium]|nr:IS1634 family transposase [Patescibacteria group bacterium]
MPSIRTTKTSSGATAIQVVRYHNRKPVILKHIGSAHTNEEVEALIQSAQSWIVEHIGQASLLSAESSRVLPLQQSCFAGVRYTLAYRTLTTVARCCGFDALDDPLVLDLAFVRIMEPCSKRRSRILLERFFGIRYAERSLYRALPNLIRHKEAVERIVLACARREFSFDCSLVLYDVTTLYFESFREDEPEEKEKGLRKTGFSKDNKPQQPQVVVGLLVTNQGFPLAYDVFRGNTFEGHTMLPVLTDFKKRHKIKSCIVVADAAMLSVENIVELQEKKLSYIVGARLANLSQKRIDTISAALKEKDGATVRVPTQHGDLICAFSQQRYRKDKHEMEKQIARAKKLVDRGESGRRAKFVRKEGGSYTFNEKLAKKTEQLLGIKGYYTNIPEQQKRNAEVIEHYRNLWRVEQSFRMSKHDLEVRPIFHWKEEAIRAHLLICFIALGIAKYMELKTEYSIQYIVDALKQVGDARILNKTTEEEILISPQIPEETSKILQQIGVSN